MNLNQFTIKSQEAIQKAQQLAMEMNHQSIENGHLIKGITMSDQSVTPYLFKKLGVYTDRINETTDKIIESYPKVEGGEAYISKKANESVQKAIASLKEFKDEFVSIEHLLLGIIRSKNEISDMLKDAGVNEKGFIQAKKFSWDKLARDMQAIYRSA